MTRLYIVASALLLLLSGCGSSQMHVSKGTFEAIKTPRIQGNQGKLKPEANYRVSLEGNYGKNKTLRLHDLDNQAYQGEDYALEASPADISYRLIQTTAGIDFTKRTKKNLGFYGAGIGAQPYPYVYGILGINHTHFELGSHLLLGLSNDKASYTGEVLWTENQLDGSWEEREAFEKKNTNLLHTYTAASLFGSLYTHRFSINYTGTIGWPWGFLDELPASTSDGESRDYDISFSMPYWIINDISLGYRYQALSINVGYNIITSSHFQGNCISVSGSVGYNY